MIQKAFGTVIATGAESWLLLFLLLQSPTYALK